MSTTAAQNHPTSQPPNHTLLIQLLHIDTIRVEILNYVPVTKQNFPLFLTFAKENYYTRRYRILTKKDLVTICRNCPKHLMDWVIWWCGVVRVLFAPQFADKFCNQEWNENSPTRMLYERNWIYVEYRGQRGLPTLQTPNVAMDVSGQHFTSTSDEEFFTNYFWNTPYFFEFHRRGRVVYCQQGRDKVLCLQFDEHFRPQILRIKIWIGYCILFECLGFRYYIILL